jgi:two-component system NarL family response regulator
MTSPQIRILCTDDHRIVREGIALIINRQPDMTVVGMAASGEEAISLFRSELPDVTLMDLQLGGGMNGVQAIRAIRRDDPAARIVVLTMYQGDEDIYRALEAGATTYLLKDTLSDDLIRVIREVHAGLQPAVSDDLKARLTKRAERPTLTPREVEVLGLVAQGLRNKEIARTLTVSEETVQVHIRNILSKLDVKDRTAAVSVALRRGIIHLP